MHTMKPRGEIMAADLAKRNVILSLLQMLFKKQRLSLQERVNNIVSQLPEGYAGFIIDNIDFHSNLTPKGCVKTALLSPGSELYEEAVTSRKIFKNLNKDYGILEHFLSMLLNKCPSVGSFYEIFPQGHFHNMLAKTVAKYPSTEFEKDLYKCITYRQNSQPTKLYQWEIFISDQENRITTLKRYIVESLLLG